ncbi:MAG TPA: galactose-1-phosphate uridylyltransferase [Candidatus Fimicola cottocaccae]|nr:galactose-1-phosphate uridylyltransferase [Candidatus Fimicola cottocaccae]
MSELRRNPITGEWVTFAVKRGARPYDFVKKSEAKKDSSKTCPFCPGNENETTKEVFQNDDKNWSIRVFPNKYPALDFGDCDFENHSFYENMNGVGIHEVIVDTPNHNEKIYDFSSEHFLDVIKVLKMRFDDMKKRDFIKYIQIFKNNGAEAGMSLVHSHWQIIGVPVMGRIQNDTLFNALEYRKKHNSCVMCDMIKNEIKENKRVVSENENFVAFTPYASKMSYELWIAPKEHISSFGEFNEKHIEDFTNIFHNMLKRVSLINKDISYNICFMDSPIDENKKYFHWYVKIVPRIGNFAGLEFSTGTFINPVMPEDAAEVYKSKKV